MILRQAQLVRAFTLTPTLSHQGRGDGLRQAQLVRAFTLTPTLSHQGRGDGLRQAQDERGRWAQDEGRGEFIRASGEGRHDFVGE